MTTIIQICLTGIITAICILILKQDNPVFAIIASIVGGILILLMILDVATDIFSTLDEFLGRSSIGGELSSILLKIIGISYLTDFSAGIIEDSGSKSLADKVILAGKLIILGVSIPIIKNLMELIINILQ